MSDFPSLGSPPGLAGMSAVQQQQLPQAQLYRSIAGSRVDGPPGQATRPSLTPDDFPTLSRAMEADGLGGSAAAHAAFGSSAGLAPGAGVVDQPASHSAGSEHAPGLSNGLETTSTYTPPTANLAKVAGSVGAQGPVSDADRFGMLGLLSTNDYGFDVAKFGFPLPSVGPLYPTFGSPWTDQSLAYGLIEPDFKLPPCYNLSQPPPAISRVHSFSDETLFYMFYTMPRDELQLAAADQLYRRHWRYHKELRLWLTKDPDSQPTARTPRGEQSVFIFFDPGVWQKVKKEYLVIYEMLEDRGSAAASGGELAAPNFRAGAQSVPPALQQYQAQGQAGLSLGAGIMDQDASAAAQAQMQQQLMLLRQRQQESAQAAAAVSRGMPAQLGYAGVQMGEMSAAGSAMYNSAAGVRSMPPPRMEFPPVSSSAAGPSMSNLAEDIAAASMV
ncbi:transcriptional regulator [Coemansia thaxteri]|nr:transcriptional regulator [Coemansia thaxteri]KAJ2481393.1 transcriptional regulator [Coemansia sp. RSA 2320]